mmetsp:Transcript_98148/g.263787  ORF Transcript_98148/g.263787 Transcript_98148/m.263787 type:complete len:261 (+) Transcript_98148:1-783(+)
MLVSLFTGCPKCHRMKPHQHAIANHYNIPHIDYASLVLAHPEDPRIWNGKNHPDWMGHQLVADVIAGVWDKVLEKSCANADTDSHVWPSAPFNKEEELALFPSCRHPMSWFSAFESIKPHSKVPQPSYLDGWRLFEDRPGKPGWISETPSVNSRAIMRVPLKFGPEPKLAVTFLRSYEGMGDADLVMNGRTATLHGLWGSENVEKVSQSFVAWFNAGINLSQPQFGEGGANGFGIAPNQEAELEIQSSGNRFKIIELSSC